MEGLLTLRGSSPTRADGRFAPSPTGTLHTGNLRTALAAWLLARAQGGRFLVRVEDLDPGRSRTEHTAGQLADLAALGLDWDGPVVHQSARSGLYADAVAALRRDGLVYRCWCTRADIRAAVAAPHGPAGDGYPGTCAQLTAAQIAAREASGRPAALRVRAGGAVAAFADRCAGTHERRVDDFVVRRGDGAFAYNLAVVVDDHEQGIGEVVRGADLLETTPRQVWLHARLGLPLPSYVHLPLVRGADGERLAKRHGAVTLADRAALGESPSAVRAALAVQLGVIERGAASDPGALVAATETLLRSAP